MTMADLSTCTPSGRLHFSPNPADGKDMNRNYKPAGHTAVSPFLLVSDAAAMLDFLRAAFDAIELCRVSAPDGSIKHAEVRLGDSIVMVGERAHAIACSVHVYVPDVDGTFHQGLAAGACSIVEPRNLAYGDRSAGLRDPQGNLWWIGTHVGTRPAANEA